MAQGGSTQQSHTRQAAIRPRNVFRATVLRTGLLVLAATSVGCETTSPDHEMRMQHGYVYYLDGAGGGGLITNWGRDVRAGFVNAGYPGTGEIFTWQTGFGVVFDQNSSVDYKRGKARKMAQEVVKRRQDYPGAPITVMGLSAGTAVAVYVLEELPRDVSVDNVVLLGASISATYDLTQALKRVNNKFYVFTSENDSVLLYAVPMAGTADRQPGSVPSAGLRGFQRPARMSSESRTEYAKLVHIDWQPRFADMGWKGGHTDSVNPKFVEEYVAPLVMRAEQYAGGAPTVVAGGVPNPDFEKWGKYGVGTTLVFEGEQLMQGQREPVRVVVKLVSKHSDKMLLQREYLSGPDFSTLERTQSYYIEPTIKPEEDPLTHPKAKIEEVGVETLTVANRELQCNVKTVAVDATFDDWGSNLRAKLYCNDTVPGGIAAASIRSIQDGAPYEVEAKLVSYEVK